MNADDDTTPKPRHLRPLVGTFVSKKKAKLANSVHEYPIIHRIPNGDFGTKWKIKID